PRPSPCQPSATTRPMSAVVPSFEGPYRATPISSGSCPSSTSATTAIRRRSSTLARACASSGSSRRKEKNRWYSVRGLNRRHSAIKRGSSSDGSRGHVRRRRRAGSRSVQGRPGTAGLESHAEAVSGSRPRGHDALQHGLGYRTENPVYDGALLEEQDHRDRLDPVASRQP